MLQYQNPETEMVDSEMWFVVVLLSFVMHVVERIEVVVVEMDDLVLVAENLFEWTASDDWYHLLETNWY
jgi:hypothetical protein